MTKHDAARFPNDFFASRHNRRTSLDPERSFGNAGFG
jgi:hypothetical protein